MIHSKSWLRLIGDIHGERRCYLTHARDAEYSIQLGDFDHDFQWLLSKGIDPAHHTFIGGNHDNYDNVGFSPHYMGDYGIHTIPDFADIFFVRGGWSIDHKGRLKHPRKLRNGMVLDRNWWPEEELTHQQFEEAIKLYADTKPSVIISHECPLGVVPFVTDPMFVHQFGYDHGAIKTRTNQALQRMTELHRPKVHVFGHYHRPFYRFLDAENGQVMPDNCPEDERWRYTLYICVGLLKCQDFPKNYLETI